jgi:hypothetical protein
VWPVAIVATLIIVIVIILAPRPCILSSLLFPFLFHLTCTVENFFEFTAVEPGTFTIGTDINQDAGLGNFAHCGSTIWTEHTFAPFVVVDGG